MNFNRLNRRDFLGATAALAGAVVLSPKDAANLTARRKTATDMVSLGRTGVKMSRLGIGTGSNGGKVQRDLGQDGFTRLIHYAYERGVTYIDTAQNYKNHEMVRAAINDVRVWYEIPATGAVLDVFGTEGQKLFTGDLTVEEFAKLVQASIKPAQ